MTESKRPLPITIRIGYEWTDCQREATAALPKERYQFILERFKNVAEEVKKRSDRNRGEHLFYAQVGRMRAKHGGELLSRLRELCERTDILAFDITGENPNVMLELGMALAVKPEKSGRVFILKQKTIKNIHIPSDLSGYFMSFFCYAPKKQGKCALVLEDMAGFRAAVRTAIIELARERGMWGESGVVQEETTEEIEIPKTQLANV